MTFSEGTPRALRLGLDPSDLDGHSFEDLEDYLESGRQPRDPSIEESPGCQLALDALERLHGMGSELIDAEAEAEADVDQGFLDRIFSRIAMDARSGRRIPFDLPDPDADLGITEGAVRGLIRSAEAAVPGLLVGRCRLEGDVTEVGAPIRIEIEASVVHGESIPRMVDQLRAEVDERLRRHTELHITSIDVVVRDIQEVSS